MVQVYGRMLIGLLFCIIYMGCPIQEEGSDLPNVTLKLSVCPLLCGQTAWAPEKDAEQPEERVEASHDPPLLPRTWTPLAAQDNGNTVPWQSAGW